MAKCMKSILLPSAGHYSDYMSDEQCDALTIIENEFGLKGFAIFVKLWQKIAGGSEGYCIKWNDRVSALFASEIRASNTLVLEIVNRMVSEGLFDKDMYDRHHILTADYIQKNWYDVKKRSYEIEEAYRLIKVTPNSENVCKTGQNASKMGQNASKTGQNASLIECNRIEYNLTECKKTESKAERLSQVKLTDEERAELERLSDRLTVESYIRSIIEWQQKNGKLNTKPYLCIKTWIGEDNKNRVNEDKGISAKEVEEFAASIDFDKLST